MNIQYSIFCGSLFNPGSTIFFWGEMMEGGQLDKRSCFTAKFKSQGHEGTKKMS
jgi:hypothetical protein